MALFKNDSSRKECTCASISPGISVLPEPSMVMVPGGRVEGLVSEIWAICPFCTRMLVEIEITESPLNRRVFVMR